MMNPIFNFYLIIHQTTPATTWACEKMHELLINEAFWQHLHIHKGV